MTNFVTAGGRNVEQEGERWQRLSVRWASEDARLMNRVIGKLAIKGFGVPDGTMDIAISAEGPVDSRWEAV